MLKYFSEISSTVIIGLNAWILINIVQLKVDISVTQNELTTRSMWMQTIERKIEKLEDKHSLAYYVNPVVPQYLYYL
ncbi:hypothetical protein ACFSKN_02115 [Mariniflexile gromovii]|uniref:Uncharacterized protein n=1 Tax=Mariniflexile gromovii TaxID=362523 RepID=A0ABS4BQM5_9FLAO|nr:hypothetical protein [Mariniflexile gromovii]MBP0902397.1 hypothetical protein [Mariniflexile gromovii]